jgi:hypothetical protein
VPDTLSETVHRMEEALKPRLRGVLHEAAFAISLVTGTVIVCLSRGTLAIVASSVYAASVALLFGTSAAYHRGTWSPRAQALMSRLDHSMIFVLIAGTYTPFSLILLHGWVRWTIFGIVWGGAIGGIIARNAFRQPPRWVRGRGCPHAADRRGPVLLLRRGGLRPQEARSLAAVVRLPRDLPRLHAGGLRGPLHRDLARGLPDPRLLSSGQPPACWSGADC